ncbi:MAG: hypothetical protein LBG90_08525 [Spirochaetaceae bacterium]|nr:hypothetical protein [Spirochaetaceae bacterium]
MSDVEEEDMLDFIKRIAKKDIGKEGKKRKMAGTRTFEIAIKFVRMSFKVYQRKNKRWINPFQGIDPPQRTSPRNRGLLSEDEVVALFAPGVLKDTMELAVCAAMFLAGLRRAEIFALKPEFLIGIRLR